MSLAETSLARVKDAIERSEYRDAITAAAAVPADELQQDQAQPLMEAILTAAAGLEDDSDDEIRAYDLVVHIGDTLPGGQPAQSSLVSKVTSALYNKGVVLSKRGRGEEAIAVYDDLVNRSRDAETTASRLTACRAMFNKGNSLLRMGRCDDAIIVYDELVRRFVTESEPALREAVGKALVNKGIALGQLKRYGDSIDILDIVVDGWSDCSETAMCERAATALINKATALYHLGRIDEAIATYDEVVARFSEDVRPSLQRYVDMALARRRGVANHLE